MTIGLRPLILLLAIVLAPAREGQADIGLVVLEPVNALGLFTRVGHAGTYLSNICPDASPVRMRLCRPGERGSVLSKYSSLGGSTDYDWAIVALDQFLHGADSPDLAPLVVAPQLHEAIQVASFERTFSAALSRTEDGGVPPGQWKTALATRFDRTIYILSIATSDADDRAIVDAFNSAVNRSRFNFFYDNCSNQTKAVFDLLLSDTDPIGDRMTGLTMQTPKGLAKTLVDRALEDPGLRLRVERYAQVPGTVGRSRDVLFPMENTYRNVTFAPYWFFGGFREVALGAMLYHQVIAPFSLAGAFEDFLSPRAGELTAEQDRLRHLQDDVRRTLNSGGPSDSTRLEREQLNATVFRRLRTVWADKQAEVHRVLGSKAQWEAFDREFQSAVRHVTGNAGLPDGLQRPFAGFEPTGRLSAQLLRYFEAHGRFYLDEDARGPWLGLVVDDTEQTAATGLAASQVLAGDHRVAFLVLAAVIDYNLYASDGRRENLEYMQRVFMLFRQVRRSFAAPARFLP